jgi:hypothetical protein
VCGQGEFITCNIALVRIEKKEGRIMLAYKSGEIEELLKIKIIWYF